MPPIKVKSSAFLFSLPPGWTSEVLERGQTRITTPAPAPYNATLDWQARVVRLGIGTYGKPINKKEYKGKGWQQRLVDDALACLRELENTKPGTTKTRRRRAMTKYNVHMESTATVRGHIVVEASSMEEAEEIAIGKALTGGDSVLWVAVGALGPITAPVIYNYDTGRRVRP